ncbi:hypothetical protein EDD22DRAFT_848875 [Suillus occidentalis]|nr:hypothetical protein EDD22DRAFT_848875 [Suillus occidentalis]
MSPCLPEYLANIVKMLMNWQVRILDNPRLFNEFATSQVDLSSDLMKNQIDMIPFKTPSQISLDEVLELYHEHIQQTTMAHMLLLDIQKHAGGPDPLLNNLQVIQEDLRELGTQLQGWLAEKMTVGRLALEDMARLEGPVDALHDAMAAS